MNLSRAIWLIAERDFRERVRSRTFILATALLVVLAVGGVVAANLGKGFFDGTKTRTVALVDPPEGMATTLNAMGAAFGMTIKTPNYADAPGATAALNAGTVDAVVVGVSAARFRDNADSDLESIVSQAARVTGMAQQLGDAGLPPETVQGILSPPPIAVSYTDPDGNGEKNAGAAFVMAIVLFGALMTYNQWILMGVIEEKSTRIVEVLLAVVPPWQLLTGKLLGVLSVAVAQMAVVGAAFLAALAVAGGVSLPQVSAGGVIVAVIWFVLGLLFYSVAFAAVGATVSRQEDASAAAAPLTMMLMAAYFVSIFLSTSASGSVAAQILSFVPPAAPLIVPVSYALGTVSVLRLALTIAVMCLAIVGVSWLGGRLYAGAVLQTGPRLGIRDTLRTIRRASVARR